MSSSLSIPARASNYGLLGQLVSDSAASSAKLNTLTQQAASGQISSSYSGLGASTTASLDLRAEMAQQKTWISGISTADTTMTTTQDVMTQIGSIASSFYAQTADLTNLNSGSVDTIAASARAALQQVAGLLDTQVGGNYIFAGSDSANPPVPDPDDILTSGFNTQISSAVGALATNGASATTASTLAIAASNTAGTTPFSTGSQSATRTSVEIGSGQRAGVGLLASANSLVASTGSSTTGSYMRDLMRGLATIGAMSSSQTNVAGFSDLVADTRTSLDGAISAMSDEAGILGNAQSAMDAQSTALGQSTTALSSQVDNLENVDVASVSTQLSLVQTQLQASYQLISNSSGLSLVKYLS